MRGPRRCADDARSHRLAAIEDFYVNPLWRHAKACERRLHVSHEASRPAEIDIRLARDADDIKDRSRQVTRSVEIQTHLLLRTRRAVTNIGAAVRERTHEATHLGDERMVLAIVSRVQPQELPRRPRLC